MSTVLDISNKNAAGSDLPAKPEESVQYVNELTTLNLGPTHPATHGIFQNILQMDGN